MFRNKNARPAAARGSGQARAGCPSPGECQGQPPRPPRARPRHHVAGRLRACQASLRNAGAKHAAQHARPAARRAPHTTWHTYMGRIEPRNGLSRLRARQQHRGGHQKPPAQQPHSMMRAARRPVARAHPGRAGGGRRAGLAARRARRGSPNERSRSERASEREREKERGRVSSREDKSKYQRKNNNNKKKKDQRVGEQGAGKRGGDWGGRAIAVHASHQRTQPVPAGRRGARVCARRRCPNAALEKSRKKHAVR